MKHSLIVCLLAFLPVAVMAQEKHDSLVVDDTCNIAQHQALIGQPAAVAEGLSLEQPLRVHAENAPVTMDYLLNRINFVTDETGAVFRIYCG